MLVQGGYSPSTTHLSVLMTTSGYSTASAASCLSLFGLSVLIGKLSFGVMADRIGAKLATSAAYIAIVAACLMALLMDGQALWPCALAAVSFGVGCPPNSVGIALVGADLSTPEVLTKTMKWMEVSATLGSIVTGVLPGIYYDAVGDYLGAYVVMAAMAGLCIPLLWVLYRTRQPAHTAAENG